MGKNLSKNLKKTARTVDKLGDNRGNIGDKLSAVFLPDIRSAYNIGSIFRTCDAAGIQKIYLSGYSPCPTDRFGRPRKDITKTALGAEKTISWEYSEDSIKLLKRLKKEGFCVVAVEQSPDAIDYKKFKIFDLKHGHKHKTEHEYKKEKIVFMFGNEVTGLQKNILKNADIVVEIPMKGKKESLNVSVTVGIALFRILGV